MVSGASTLNSFLRHTLTFLRARPAINQEDGTYIIELICSLLEPMGSFKQIQTSNPKSNRNDNTQLRPDIADFLTIGFNKTNEALEQQARKFYHSMGVISDTSALEKETTNNGVWLVFVCKQDMKSQLLWSHFPALCAAASLASETSSTTSTEQKSRPKSVRLIQLPAGSCTRISNALGLDRVSVIGLRPGSSVASELENRILKNDIGLVEVPGWMNQIKLNPPVISSLKTTAPIKPPKYQKNKPPSS